MASLKEAFDSINTWYFKSRFAEGEPTMAIQADIGHGGWGHTCDYVLQSYPSQCLCGKINPDDVKEFEKTFGSGDHDGQGLTRAVKKGEGALLHHNPEEKAYVVGGAASIRAPGYVRMNHFRSFLEEYQKEGQFHIPEQVKFALCEKFREIYESFDRKTSYFDVICRCLFLIGHTEYIKDIRNVQNLHKRKKRDLRYGGQRNVPNDNQFS